MAFSASGRSLFVPLLGQQIARLDTGRDDFQDLYQLYGEDLAGEIRAVATNARSNLFALSSDPSAGAGEPTGSLIRLEYVGNGEIEQWEQSPNFKVALDEDAPRGLMVQSGVSDNDDQDNVYVYYSGSGATRAMTRHSALTLSTLGTVPANLAGRTGPIYQAGDAVPFSPLASLQHQTATRRAFAAVVDRSLGAPAYVLFFGTGNVAIATEAISTGTFELRGTTRVDGTFTEPDLLFTFEPTPPYLGFETTSVVRYLQDRFPLAMSLEQGGRLLAVPFTGGGRAGVLRIFDTIALRDQLETTLFDRLAGALDGPGLEGTTDNGRLDLPLTALLDIPRDVAFGPQVSVVSPRAGSRLRGAVAVHTIIRDPAVQTLACNLYRVEVNGSFTLVASDPGVTLTEGQRELGFALRQDFREDPEVSPACVFPPQVFPADTEYAVQVIGLGADLDARMLIPFSWEKGYTPP
jgi:hypothetical protein